MKHKLKQRIKNEGKKPLIRVSDDWYPNLQKHFVDANIYFIGKNSNGFTSKVHRVSFWGGDDFGMEKVYETKEAAQKEYDMLIKKTLNQKMLKELGFNAC